MKLKLAVFICAFVLTISCKDDGQDQDNISDSKVEKNIKPTLKGTWELVGFYNYKDNEVVDSFTTDPNFRQLKIYTDKKVMWCKYRPADSSEWFGYGSYKFNDNELTEVLDFGSRVMNEVIEENKEFIFDLKLEKNRFEQIELGENGNRIYSENYKRIE